MKIISNTPRRPLSAPDHIPYPSVDAASVAALMAKCPHAGVTPLVQADALASKLGINGLWVKDERTRMGLGSFKALGAAYVIAHDASQGSVAGRTYVTASAGNHGLSVAAGAAAFGAKAIIYLSNSVPESFAERLRAIGATVHRVGTTYEESMDAAMEAAQAEGCELLSDTSWPEYYERSHRLMEGYLELMREVIAQAPSVPTHIMLQAGVGGMACACAALAREEWGQAPKIIVVEPETAPALVDSLVAGHSMVTTGPVSNMGRLDCKEPSLIALKSLARDADAFVTLTEVEGQDGADALAAYGLETSPSGGAGIAALIAGQGDLSGLGIDATSTVLCILSEGPA